MRSTAARLVDSDKGTSGVSLVENSPRQEPKRKYFWTTVEVSTLKEICSSPTTWEEAQKRLPGRSEAGAYLKANELGLKVSWVRERREDTEAIDARLRQFRESGLEDGMLSSIAEEFGVERWVVSRRAAKLNISTPRLTEQPWEARELEIAENYGADGPSLVQRQLKLEGFNRTLSSVVAVLKRRHIERLASSSMSARAVGELVGVDPKVVVRWIERMGLKANKVPDGWSITRRNMRSWLLDHPDAFDLRKVKQVWFMALMRGE